MQLNHVVIADIAYALPPEVWTSEAIEQHLAPLYERIKLPYGRLELMTGIRERRFWDAAMKPSDMSVMAAKNLKKWMNPDVLVHAAVCRNQLEPSTAAYVHRALNLPSNTQIFDLSNACLGFLNAMVVAASMIECGQIKTALIVSGENGKPLLDWTFRELLNPQRTRQDIKPYFANLTIGAGAVAAMLCHDSVMRGPHIVNWHAATDTRACNLCEGNAADNDALSMQTDSEQLLIDGVQLAQFTFDGFLAKTGWNVNTIQRIITHQVGQQHRKALYQALDLSLEKDHSTFPFLGNTGSVAVPLTFAHSIEQIPLQLNERIALLGIGSGLSSVMLAVENK